MYNNCRESGQGWCWKNDRLDHSRGEGNSCDLPGATGAWLWSHKGDCHWCGVYLLERPSPYKDGVSGPDW